MHYLSTLMIILNPWQPLAYVIYAYITYLYSFQCSLPI